MISLEEQSKICNLIASCNDMINGKFILVDYKISNILKNITDSKAVYNLISNCMNNFSFEREFSKAQLRSANSKKFSLPKESEKILPFVFCIMVSIKNKIIDIDLFLKEFYQSEKGRADEYLKFASEIILPFRDIIADYFEIDLTKKDLLKNIKSSSENQTNTQENEIFSKQINSQTKKPLNTQHQTQTKERAEQILQIKSKTKKENISDRENQTQLQFENKEISESPEETFPETPQNKTVSEKNSDDYFNNIFEEIQEVCTNIISELNSKQRIKENLKENVIYITQTIFDNCEKGDLKNTAALITAFEYISSPIRSLRFLAKELKNLLQDFFE